MPPQGPGFEPSLEWDPHVSSGATRQPRMGATPRRRRARPPPAAARERSCTRATNPAAPPAAALPQVRAYLSAALGADHFGRVSAALCRPPLRTCVRVNTLRARVEVRRGLAAAGAEPRACACGRPLQRAAAGCAVDPGDCSLPQDVAAEINAALAAAGIKSSRGSEGGCGAAPVAERVAGAPMALMLPGSGPHAIDYAACGEGGAGGRAAARPRRPCRPTDLAVSCLPHPQARLRKPHLCLPPPSTAALAGGREVIVGRRAAESVLRGAHVFVPGVLAATAGLEAGDLVAVVADVERPAGAAGGGAKPGVTRGTVLPRRDGSGDSGGGAAAAADAAAPAPAPHPALAVAAGTLCAEPEAGVEPGGSGCADGSPEATTTSGSGGSGGGGGGGGGGGRLYVGVGRMCMGRAELFKARSGVGVEMVERVYDVASVPGASGASAAGSVSRVRTPGAAGACPASFLLPHSLATPHAPPPQTSCAAASCCRTFPASPPRSRSRRHRARASSTCAPRRAARARCWRS
jgi:hypothetical protein